ncbi:MAG: dephospho-CoA kinase [Flavobacteriaceae bacterium]|nr:dephospho-CoA kinase [Flavobacteriaceae bacterium]
MKTKVLVLTGGIGTGKTIVASMFKDLGVVIYNADNEAKLLMNTSPVLKEKIIALFGMKAYENNLLNRSYISRLVFSNKSLLVKLNSIVHPAVKIHFNEWLKFQNSPYVVKEVAILFEIGAENAYNFILTITAPKDIRIKRLVKRDGKSVQEIELIMSNQLHSSQQIKKSDFVINNTDLEKTRKEVYNIHNEIIKLCL